MRLRVGVSVAGNQGKEGRFHFYDLSERAPLRFSEGGGRFGRGGRQELPSHLATRGVEPGGEKKIGEYGRQGGNRGQCCLQARPEEEASLGTGGLGSGHGGSGGRSFFRGEGWRRFAGGETVRQGGGGPRVIQKEKVLPL